MNVNKMSIEISKINYSVSFRNMQKKLGAKIFDVIFVDTEND